ncbi:MULTISPECIES: hypothetical protein [Streptomyces]|uniref:Uncharacterized protein n=1 Tax=Streptomyces yanii TaxID=78510 RepID=A0ABV5R4G8_9ACTN
MDPLSLLVGAGIAVTGFLAGRFGGRRRTAERPELPEPVCTCGHGLAYHDQESQACHGLVKTPVEFDKVYGAVDFEMRQCTCRRYVGPVALETFYAPEITD